MKTYVVLEMTINYDQVEIDNIYFVGQSKKQCMEMIAKKDKGENFFWWELYECEGDKITKIDANIER